jgi:predicted nucleotidyltransferase
MPSQDDPRTAQIEDQLGAALDTEADVLFAYLYGSVAKGRERPGSDIDVAVFLDTPPGRPEDRVLEIEAALEQSVGRAVQAVALNTAPLELVQNVLRTGRPISCRSDTARARFYVAHGRAYFDQAHARGIFRRYQMKRIERGEFGG